MRFGDTHRLVESILIDEPETRDSDTLLYLRACQRIDPRVSNMPFETVLMERKRLGFPNMESVGRCRRKIQEYNPLLRASETVTDGRYEKYKEVLEYVSE